MIVVKKVLPRRTFVRGVGATLALPLMDAMVPAFSALAQTPAAPIKRSWMSCVASRPPAARRLMPA